MSVVPDASWRDQTFGKEPADWQRAKLEARSTLVETARRRSIITYTELRANIISVTIPRTGNAFASAIGLLLGQVSADESDRLGRRMMLSAVAVNNDLQPGPGFYDLVRELKWSEDWSYWLTTVWKQYL